ncbi:MAG: hypothetical protein AAF213_04545 [Pseudomonadota bacterium]
MSHEYAIDPRDPSPTSVEISADGEPVLILPVEFAANDMIEIHVGDHRADIIIDGRMCSRTRQLTNTLRSWLVMAEEVALRPVNCDVPRHPDGTPCYAPVYNCHSGIQRRI